jgi:hypothetical protein
MDTAAYTVSRTDPFLGCDGASAPPSATEEGASTAERGKADDVVSGRSHDRQRAVFTSASGQLRGRLWEFFRGRRQSGEHPQRRTAAHVETPCLTLGR